MRRLQPLQIVRSRRRAARRSGQWLHLMVEFLSLRCPGDDPPCKLDGIVALTAAVIDVLKPTTAMVDGFSDCSRLPAPAAAALADLQEAALRRPSAGGAVVALVSMASP